MGICLIFKNVCLSSMTVFAILAIEQISSVGVLSSSYWDSH